jgi:hypothetical protein
MNQYKTNPPGPVGPIGLLVVTGTYASGTVALTNVSAGTIYQVTGAVTFTISSPSDGTFWMVQNTSQSSVTVTYPITGSTATVAIPAGKFTTLIASSTTNIVVY